MSVQKRISQLNETYASEDSDFLAIDNIEKNQTEKISKANFLSDCLKKPPFNSSTKNWTWAVKNEDWYRIYPDEYVFEAPIDDKIYVRINGTWKTVDGVSGDMLRSIYDTKNRMTDIYDYCNIKNADSSAESIAGNNVIEKNNFIEKKYCIRSELLDFKIFGHTIDALTNQNREKSFDNKSTIKGLTNFKIFKTGKNLILGKKFIKGDFSNYQNQKCIRSDSAIKVNPGEKYILKETPSNLEIKIYSTTDTLEKTGIYNLNNIGKGQIIIIPDNVFYIGIEIQNFHLNENDEKIYDNFEEPFNKYFSEIIFCELENLIEKNINVLEEIHSFNSFSDIISIKDKKIYKYLKNKRIVGTEDWVYSDEDNENSFTTFCFKLNLSNASWINKNEIYGISDVLISDNINNLLKEDKEKISFFDNYIYIKINAERLNKSIDSPKEEKIEALKLFLQKNNINILFFDSNYSEIVLEEEISDLTNLKDGDNCFRIISKENLTEENFTVNPNIQIITEEVINHLIRKSGDIMNGRLIFTGENNLFTKTLDGLIDETGKNGPVFINKNSNNKVYVNGENPVLDLRDFSTELNWEPKAKTIADKEANDKRLVNAEYIHRDYAPLNNPSFVGIPTAPKANKLGTNQIATGEFIEENYFSKTEADNKYVLKVNGILEGEPVLNSTLPKIISNKKRLPNVEFIESYYYDKDQTGKVFAPLNSPVFTGTPTAPTPDGTIDSQIVNLGYLKNKYLSSSGGSLYGDLRIAKTSPSEGGNLSVEGIINIARTNTEGAITNKDLVLITDKLGNIITSTVTSAELLTLSNIKSNIQEQINKKSSSIIVKWEE